jgi:4-hydroxybenzoate polyprenyltransferase
MISVAHKRPRWRAYLLLARVSNLPTVWSNVVAGTLLGVSATGLAATVPSRTVVWSAVAASLFYTGGMFLNDAFDAPFDRRARPERPIPRGDVSQREAFGVGAAFLASGLVLLSTDLRTLMLGAVLAVAIVFYDMRHKGDALAPLIMGACRGLVYLMAAARAGDMSAMLAAGALAMTGYVSGLTVVARVAGADARWLVPVLIAGISLVDALFVWLVAPSHAPVALLAAAGFPLTLALQRWVPGD